MEPQKAPMKRPSRFLSNQEKNFQSNKKIRFEPNVEQVKNSSSLINQKKTILSSDIEEDVFLNDQLADDICSQAIVSITSTPMVNIKESPKKFFKSISHCSKSDNNNSKLTPRNFNRQSASLLNQKTRNDSSISRTSTSFEDSMTSMIPETKIYSSRSQSSLIINQQSSQKTKKKQIEDFGQIILKIQEKEQKYKEQKKSNGQTSANAQRTPVDIYQLYRIQEKFSSKSYDNLYDQWTKQFPNGQQFIRKYLHC